MEALGIDLKLLIAQVINFLVVMFLLARFLYNPITKMLETRSQTIEKGLKDSEKAKAQLEKAETEAEKIREKAFKDANEILASTKKESAEKSSRNFKES